MRITIIILTLLFIGLQYKLWFADGGLLELWQLRQTVVEQKSANQERVEENEKLAAEVADLKLGVAALEERARNELGMIKDDEVFYQIVDGGNTDAK
ncbi:MAG: cell division protein FtsB [Gammaproteobacteria bacterium]